MKIRKISIICIIAFIVNCMPVFGYTYPSAFWSINNKYAQALDTQNHYGIIEYGNQIINLISKTQDSTEKRDILVTRYNEVGKAYAAIGEYDKAAETFQALYDYASPYSEFYEYYKLAKAKALQYKSTISLYTDKGVSTYYGAVNEKENGVLFGVCVNGETRSQLDNESMVLTYQEVDSKLESYNASLVRKASEEGYAIEFALNCTNEAQDIKNIRKFASNLKSFSDLFAKYPDVPIYLRFGAEFDVWTDLADPEEFKNAFRYVSEYFKQRNENVAIVWCPNQVSNWYVNIDDYYPGDQYVDWVGIALYSQKYFLGDKNQPEDSEIAFKSGKNSDPVLAVKEIVEKYGNRKPIMVAASGCGHKVLKTGEDTTDFAVQRLRESYYYLPMVYPQIKLMAYFDWYVANSNEKDDFRLSSNKRLQNEYLNLVRGSRFIQDSFTENTGYCNRPVYNGISVDRVFEVSCYAHMYDAAILNVVYYIDGNYVAMSQQMPYTTFIDASAYSGAHKLKAVATFNNGKTLETESTVYIGNTNQNISVEISGDRVRFDQEPIAYNDRVMVPMRKIFEELGAKVSWDNNTQTATGRKGDRTVKISVGKQVMYVNNTPITLDTAPIALSARVLVPVRAVAEGLGCDVDWDSRNKVVEITPKVARWSDWTKDLPDDVDEDLYYIEEMTEYRYRTRSKEEFTLEHKMNTSNYVGSETTYGEWSNWSDTYVSETAEREVERRTNSTPMNYHYAHYCTGNESDSSIRFKTSSGKFSDKCSYHDLGWWDSLLPEAPDGTGYVNYRSDGKFYRCPNTCYRWYIVETSGGDYTEYRYRSVKTLYTYWEWGDWSRWSSWDEEDPYDFYEGSRNSIDVEERTVYRYKEK